jgi:hypothetical protein
VCSGPDKKVHFRLDWRHKKERRKKHKNERRKKHKKERRKKHKKGRKKKHIGQNGKV